MSWRLGNALLAALLVAACGREAPPRGEFGFEAPTEVVPVIVMRSDSATIPGQGLQRELQVILPTDATEAQARATLMHLMDSLRAHDPVPAAMRVIGFVFGPVDATTGLADVVPAISGLRAAGSPAARPRTEFLIHRPFPTRQ